VTDLDDAVARILAGLTNPNGTEQPSVDSRLRDRFIHGAEVLHLPEPGWVIHGVMPTGALVLPYGPPKSGKSFVALDQALCIATGNPWAGHQTEPGTVVYVAAEGIGGLARRVLSWLTHHEVDDPGPIHWLKGAVNLTNRLEVESFTRICAELQPVAVYLDTLARCSLGADENSAKDMGTVVAALDQIRDITGAAVAPVHHAGKDSTKGARGSSALLGAADAVYEITGSDGVVTMRCTAMKDAEAPPSLTFKMRTIEQSVALDPVDPTTMVPESVWAVLDTLRQIDPGDGVSATAWEHSCEVSQRTFYRARKWLVDHGSVDKNGARYVAVNERS
jgi:AAA domain